MTRSRGRWTDERQPHLPGPVLLDRGIRDQLRLGWRLLRDERVSALKFALPALLALYLVSPVDVIPDILLGPGQMDDRDRHRGVLLIARVIPRWRPNMSSVNMCGR